jgi:hypothetical protein
MTPTREWLRSELGRAILTACEYAGDRVLIDRDSSERSIMFRIGRYLAPVIEDCHPGHLWVDLEYNRVAGATETEEHITKMLKGLNPRSRKVRFFLTSLSTIAPARRPCTTFSWLKRRRPPPSARTT